MAEPKKQKEPLYRRWSKFDLSLFALFIIFMLLAILSTILIVCGFDASWFTYAADSVLSILGTLITVRVIQKNKKDEKAED